MFGLEKHMTRNTGAGGGRVGGKRREGGVSLGVGGREEGMLRGWSPYPSCRGAHTHSPPNHTGISDEQWIIS